MTKNEDELVSPKLVEKIKEVFAGTQVLIVSPNKTARNNLKRVFATLGFNSQYIGVIDNYGEAKSLIEEHTPSIIFSSLKLGEEKTAIDLYEVHKNFFPNRLQAMFFVMTSLEYGYLNSYQQEYGLDGFIQGEQNFQTLVTYISKVIEKKLKPTKKDILINKIEEALFNQESEKALTLLKASSEIEITDEEKFYYLAMANKLSQNDEQAIESFSIVLSTEPSHYKALSEIITLLYRRKEYDDAHDFVLQFLEEYPPLPQYLPIFLKVFLFKKDYVNICLLCEKYMDDESLDLHTKLNMSAALALSGKSLLDENSELAKDALAKAIQMSGGNSFNILSMVITSLLESKSDLDLAMTYLEKYKHNFIESAHFIALEFDVLSRVREPGETLLEATSLIKKDVKSYRIYEELISCSVKVGRRKEAIEDLIFEACREFPEKTTLFKSFANS